MQESTFARHDSPTFHAMFQDESVVVIISLCIHVYIIHSTDHHIDTTMTEKKPSASSEAHTQDLVETIHRFVGKPSRKSVHKSLPLAFEVRATGGSFGSQLTRRFRCC